MFKPLTMSLGLAIALGASSVSMAGGLLHGSSGCSTCGLASPQGVVSSPQLGSSHAYPTAYGSGQIYGGTYGTGQYGSGQMTGPAPAPAPAGEMAPAPAGTEAPPAPEVAPAAPSAPEAPSAPATPAPPAPSAPGPQSSLLFSTPSGN